MDFPIYSLVGSHDGIGFDSFEPIDVNKYPPHEENRDPQGINVVRSAFIEAPEGSKLIKVDHETQLVWHHKGTEYKEGIRQVVAFAIMKPDGWLGLRIG